MDSIRSASLSVALAFVTLATAGARPAQTAQPHKIPVGDVLPAHDLTDAAGRAADLKTPPKVRVIVFVRHSREYERDAVHDVQKIVTDLGRDDLAAHVVWVAQDRPEDAALTLPGEPWFDRRRETIGTLGIFVYPMTIVVAKDHKVIEAVPSHPPDFPLRVEAAARRALGMPARSDAVRTATPPATPAEVTAEVRKARLRATFATRLLQSGKTEEAGVQFARANELAADDPFVAEAYATYLLETGQPDAARAEIDKRLAASPDDGTLRLARARLLLREGKDAEAETLLEELRTTSPDPRPVLLELGKLREKQERWQEAAALYREALERELASDGR